MTHDNDDENHVVHIAGFPVQIGPRLRQRCAWCSFVLIDQNLENVAVAVEPGVPPGEFPTWETGALIGTTEEHAGDSGMSWVAEPDEDGEEHIKLPARCCAKLLPDDVTAMGG